MSEQPARRPPAGLPGLDPAWSRVVAITDPAGIPRGWHVLDSGTEPTHGTIVCVHGNPTWSYLWRGLVAEPPAGWRVVAPDQLGMGWSARLAEPRTYAERVADLGTLIDSMIDTLAPDGPVVLVAHDWGGPIALGWAVEHVDRLAGVVLTNTAITQPGDSAAPTLIRLARSPALRDLVCVRTPAFVRGATAVSRPPLAAPIRAAYAAPYGSAGRRRAVGDFVADIPLESDHPSAAALAATRDRLTRLADVPTLIMWGPRDPVFGAAHLRDLTERLPHAELHRFEGAGHLVAEDAPQALDAAREWIMGLGQPRPGSAPQAVAEPAAPPVPDLVLGALRSRPRDALAVAELGSGGAQRTTFGELADRVEALVAGLVDLGVRPGDRVALLVPPGRDLLVTLYAAWRAGAVVVLADAGLGARALGRALRGADPAYVIGIPRGLAAARALRIPGRRIAVGESIGPTALLALGAEATIADLEARGRGRPAPPPPADDADCAVLFTSGATGPPKGVVYRNRQVRAQVDAVRTAYAIGPEDRIVAAFAPFAIYGPLLGIASVVPDVDVTRPGELTATLLADAVAAVDATVVFAAPAALRSVVRTADTLHPEQRAALGRVRLLLSAGAPVPLPLLRRLATVLPGAELHTPYGMTEALPVTTVSLAELEQAGSGNGVCVGHPLSGVETAVCALDHLGRATGEPTDRVGVTGELLVRAAHVKDRYDRLWLTDERARADGGWHRTGDVGHVDADGRVWVEGRLAHVVVTSASVVTPVGLEQRIERLESVQAAAIVGVGPAGTQQVVAVVQPRAGSGRTSADELAEDVRAVTPHAVAAVLVTKRLPVDVRHQSKVDRTRVARWAGRVLAGGRAGSGP